MKNSTYEALHDLAQYHWERALISEHCSQINAWGRVSSEMHTLAKVASGGRDESLADDLYFLSDVAYTRSKMLTNSSL